MRGTNADKLHNDERVWHDSEGRHHGRALLGGDRTPGLFLASCLTPGWLCSLFVQPMTLSDVHFASIYVLVTSCI